MRKLATIQKIVDIRPIKDADKIELAQVNDWHVVVKKDQFKIGSFVVFCEIDSLMPLDNPHWDFLANGSSPKTVNIDGKEYTGYKLKTIRLKGELSQGLILPTDVLPPIFTLTGDEQIGMDVSEMLGIVKWEAKISAQLAGQVKGTFPSFLPKTDEERVQNYRKTIEQSQGILMYVTEKLDGTSTTFYKNDGVFGVCSRNMDLKETEGNSLWKAARTLKVEENLPEGYAIQGELIGEGIQGNPLKRVGQEFYAFNVYNIKEGKYLDFEDMFDFLKARDIPMVPLMTSEYNLTTDIDWMLKLADGKSSLNEGCAREGLVFRPLSEMRDSHNNRFSFKVISNEYLLKTNN